MTPLGPGSARAEPVFTSSRRSGGAAPQPADRPGHRCGANASPQSGRRGANLPSLSFSTGASVRHQRFNPQTNTTVTGSSDSYSAGLSAQLTLFNGGQRAAGLESARAQLAAADAGLISQRFAVILNVQRTFFEVLRADDLLRVAEARVKRAEESLEAARRRAEVGTGTRSDVLRANLEVTNARQQLLQAQNQRRTAAFALGRLVGVEGAVRARHDEPLEPRPLALGREELRELALRQSPVVRAAEADLVAANASLKAARAQYFPSITASSGYDWFNQDPTLTGGRTSWSLRLGLSYPIFNRFQREESVSRASVQVDIARAAAGDARRQVLADLERILGALELAGSRSHSRRKRCSPRKRISVSSRSGTGWASRRSSTRSPRSSTWSRRRSISLRRDTTIRSPERSSRRSSAGVCDIEHETRGRRPGRFEEMNRIRSILAAGTIFVAAASFTGCRESAAVETNGGSEIAYAERRTLDIRAEAAGLVEPIRIVDVKSKASGEILSIHVETGDFVQRGALLAEVDPRDVRNRWKARRISSRPRAPGHGRSPASARRGAPGGERDHRAGIREHRVRGRERALAVRQGADEPGAGAGADERRRSAPLDDDHSKRQGRQIASRRARTSRAGPRSSRWRISRMQVRTLVDETDIGQISQLRRSGRSVP